MSNPRTKTHEQFVKEVSDLFGDEYTVLGKYMGSTSKIKLRHNTCGHEYETVASYILRKRRCPRCFGGMRKTQEQFEQDVRNLVGEDYTVLGEYKNNLTKILVKHNECGKNFMARPSDFLSRSRCPNCSEKARIKKLSKTHEQFLQEVEALVGDEYTVLEQYKSSVTKILMKHNICGNEYKVAPSYFLRGTRCPECAKEKNRRRKTSKTHEQFVAEVYELVGDEYTVLGEYKGVAQKILMRHNKCGYEYYVTPQAFLCRTRCPKCAGNMKVTAEVFTERMKNLVGEEYTIVGEFKSLQDKILMRHNKCGHEYMVAPGSFLNGRRCPNCQFVVISQKTAKTHEQFVAEVKEAVGDEYTVLGRYKNARTKILVRHNDCEFKCEYKVGPNMFLRGSRCPMCSGHLKTTESFKQEAYDLVGDEYTVLGEYVGSETKILMRHNTCGSVRGVKPRSFLAGTRCLKHSRSKSEQAIEKILDDNNVLYISEFSFPGERLFYDFAVFDGQGLNEDAVNIIKLYGDQPHGVQPVLLIEFDGKQHENPVDLFGGEEVFRGVQERDEKKNRLAEKLGIPLLRVKYDQVYKKSDLDLKKLKEVVLSNLKPFLGDTGSNVNVCVPENIDDIEQY